MESTRRTTKMCCSIDVKQLPQAVNLHSFYFKGRLLIYFKNLIFQSECNNVFFLSDVDRHSRHHRRRRFSHEKRRAVVSAQLSG